jgi:hypothetical protein
MSVPPGALEGVMKIENYRDKNVRRGWMSVMNIATHCARPPCQHPIPRHTHFVHPQRRRRRHPSSLAVNCRSLYPREAFLSLATSSKATSRRQDVSQSFGEDIYSAGV